ncbi:thermonuclease family protein [Lentzea kentuckyensis]|uniref:thermonuclease family protein n=1 Tax=Lentzea kentuckyensis TaxID=360086 RepID=UPI000A3CF3C1|nr:hypothetical protein [Lentzea kentuckyensis]
MFRPIDLIIRRTRLGAVRRFWWRSSQGARITIASLGAVAALATTSAADFSVDVVPGAGGHSELDQAVHRGDSLEVIVRAVSEVDSFEGVEAVTGLFFHVRVVGLRRDEGCWLVESRRAAQDLLRGETIRLVVKNGDVQGDERLAGDVLLPDGSDYARTVVGGGAAAADPEVREDLAAAESTARQERRGLWGAGCAIGEATAVPSGEPSSSPPGAVTTTSAPAATTTTTAPPAPSSPPASSTSPAPPADDWVDDRVGGPCLLEGMRRTSPRGNVIVCTHDDKGKLRWRRAE